MKSSGENGRVDESRVDDFNNSESIEQPNKLNKKNNTLKRGRPRSKPTKYSDPSRKKSDQEIVHKYAKMIDNPLHTQLFDELNYRIKARVLKFVDDEQKLLDYCRKYNSPYEKPTTESDYTRRQRVKGRVKYYLKEKKKQEMSQR